MMDQSASLLYLFHGPEIASYGFGQGHPFGPDRHDVFINEAKRRGLLNHPALRSMTPVSCDQADLALFHKASYIDQVKRQSFNGEGYLDLGDTPAYKGVFESASFVVGTVVQAVTQIMSGNVNRAFVPIAGLHHARRGGAAGFCVFNDIGVACEVLLRRYQINNIAYIDIDAHHGDGVYYGFEDNPDIVIVDSHEDGRYLYPGTGAANEIGIGAALGTKLNLPLPPDCDDQTFAQLWLGASEFLRAHPAQFYILQCGADSIGGDPITHLRLSPQSHAMVTQQLRQLADQHAQGRFLALGGGGYNRKNIAATWCAVLEQMLHSD